MGTLDKEVDNDAEKDEAVQAPTPSMVSLSEEAPIETEGVVERLLISFASNTTAHGVQRLTTGPTPQRLFWLAIILGSCAGFSVHLNQLVNQYLSYPVSSNTVTESRDMQFPSVTVCSTDNIPSVNYDPGIQPPDYLFTGNPRRARQIIMDTAMLYYQLRLPDWNSSVMSWPNETFDDGRFASKKIVMAMNDSFQQPYEIVLKCQYNSQSCGFENFTVYRDEQMFHCLTFDPPNGTVARPGIGNGLYMVLLGVSDSLRTDDEQAEYTAGFRIALHDRDVKPDLSTATFEAPYGTKTLAKFSVHSFERVNVPTSPCVDELPEAEYTEVYSSSDPNKFEHRTYRGWTRDCEWRRMQEEFVTECGCLGSHLPLPRDLMERGLRPCHDKLSEDFFYREIRTVEYSNSNKSYIILNTTGQYYRLTEYIKENLATFSHVINNAKCFDRVRHRQNTASVSSDAASCQSLCRVNQYSVLPDRVPWPSNLNLAEFIINRIARRVRVYLMAESKPSPIMFNLMRRTRSIITQPSISVVDLHPMSTKATVTTETRAYELRNLFSDFGGILGLWVGTSVITVLELLEFLGQLLVFGIASVTTNFSKV